MRTLTLVTLEGLGLILLVLLGIWAKATVSEAPRFAATLRVPVRAEAISWTLLCTC